jgi:hypothetical protein
MADPNNAITVDKPIGDIKGVESVLDLLSDDDDSSVKDDKSDKDDKKDKKSESLEDDEDKDEDKDEDDDPEDDDESDDDEDSDDDKSKKDKLDLDEDDDLNVTGVPKRQEILKAFPELFKKFPSIEKAIYRENEYAKVFPSLDDAKDAAEKVETLKQVESELLDGNLENLLGRLKSTDQKAFGKITKNYLNTLRSVDKDAYIGILSGTLKNVLNDVFQNGKKLDDGEDGNEGRQLTIAARLLHKYFFNDINVTPAPGEKEQEENPKDKELKSREEAANKRDFEVALSSVVSRVNDKINGAIDKIIDPNEAMTPYVRRNAVKDVLSQLDKEMSTDSRFRAQIDRLWDRSRKANYSDESKKEIRLALLSKANSLLPPIVRKVKGDALKGTSEKRSGNSERPKFKGSANPEKKNFSEKNNDSGKKKPSVSSVSGVMDFLGS